jgi:hypothetical protein
VAAIFAVAWDLNHLNKDFNNLFALLRAARSDAFYKDMTIIVRFNDKTVTSRIFIIDSPPFRYYYKIVIFVLRRKKK